jgi:nitrate reductase NapAB chaperone NapD
MQALCEELAAIESCEILPAENQDVIVIVTETPDEKTEEELQVTLKNLPNLQSLSLAFGCDTSENQVKR